MESGSEKRKTTFVPYSHDKSEKRGNSENTEFKNTNSVNLKEAFAKKIKEENMNKEEARRFVEENCARNSYSQDMKRNVQKKQESSENIISTTAIPVPHKSSYESEIKNGSQSVRNLSKQFESYGRNSAIQNNDVNKSIQNEVKRNSVSEAQNAPVPPTNGNHLKPRSKSMGPKPRSRPMLPANMINEETYQSKPNPKAVTVVDYKITDSNKQEVKPSKVSNKIENIPPKNNVHRNVAQKIVNCNCILPKQGQIQFEDKQPYTPSSPKSSTLTSNIVQQKDNTSPKPQTLSRNPDKSVMKSYSSYSFVHDIPSKVAPNVMEKPQISLQLNPTTLSPEKQQIPQQQKPMTISNNDRKSINILILGETGVGKSTWINAFVNYLSFNSLEEAMAEKSPTLIIPTRFSMFDKNNRQHEIQFGGQDFAAEGESETKNAKVYLFQRGQYDIHIVDTPGIDDTQGEDDKNLHNILQTIAPFKELHAVCFLFKANIPRLSQSFRNNIHKLLSNLSKSALENACFVFTNSRGTFFQPGETMVLLQAYFKELKEKEGLLISIKENNTFCFDNEAFRFLCAHFSGIEFTQMEIKTYEESWRRSAMEIIRLLNLAATLRPHLTSETLSINETRTWILQLINPIMKVLGFMQINLETLKESIQELEAAKSDFEQLQKRRIMIPEISFEVIPLRYPQIVCNNEKCVKYETGSGRPKRIQKRICHEMCKLPYARTEIFPDPIIKKCKQFLGETCKICGCNWMDHQRIFYRERYVEKFIALNVANFGNMKDEINVKQDLLNKTKNIIDAYSNELNTILNAMATFSLFLYQNGICQKCDIFYLHLQNLIENEEKMLRAVPSCDQKNCYQLSDLLTNYQHIRQNIFRQNSLNKLSLENVQQIRQKILALPLTGSNISKMFNIHVETDIQDHDQEIIRFEKSFADENVTTVKL